MYIWMELHWKVHIVAYGKIHSSLQMSPKQALLDGCRTLRFNIYYNIQTIKNNVKFEQKYQKL